ncbi:MAG TPA: hypothetical protein VFW23_11285 [Tepidisphaeraceae bacterium]|nr:hypothetical protein [Tepidisphaeraceae bacterium]
MRRLACWMLNAVTVLCLLVLLEVLSNIISLGWYGAGAEVMLWRLSPNVPAHDPRLVHRNGRRDPAGDATLPPAAAAQSRQAVASPAPMRLMPL